VVTAAHKVKKYLESDEVDSLTVRLGDFDTTTTTTSPEALEEFPDIVRKVNCIKLQPRTKIPFEFNVAVMKLEKVIHSCRLPDTCTDTCTDACTDTVNAEDVITLFTPSLGADTCNCTCADPVNAVDVITLFAFMRNPKKKTRQGNSPREVFDLRAGLLADLNDCVGPLGEDTCVEEEDQDNNIPDVDKFRPRVYSNTVCLPGSPSQFPAGKRCWLAAWGQGGQEQREVGGRFVYNQIILIYRSAVCPLVCPSSFINISSGRSQAGVQR
jgi:hypothetical protein